ncbi:MAG: hypothetical protein JWP01_834 [Myxococcales bacterium]|nr:hypothetical protein [Myxococcales bacterium]
MILETGALRFTVVFVRDRTCEVSRMMRCSVYVLCCVWLVVGGCSSDQRGAADVSVAIDAVSAADVHDVQITITGPGMSPMVTSLVLVGTSWQGTIGQIPVGADRTFLGEARDANGRVIYAGSLDGVGIGPHMTAVVRLILQEIDPPPPFTNVAPRITGLYLSSNTVEPDETVSLHVTASDGNGDPITYSWIASDGGLAATAADAIWTAPAAEGTYTVTVTATDPFGAMDVLGVTIQVAVTTVGAANVQIVFNSFPRVTNVTSSLGRIAVGDTTMLLVVASDPESDPLAYAWTSSCTGTFSSATGMTTSFVRTSGLEPDCTFQVTVSDGVGYTQGTLTIAGDASPQPDLAPQVDAMFQSRSTVAPFDPVRFRVVGHDPGGGAITIVWTASIGTFGVSTVSAGASEIVWTAPCFTGVATVTAILRNTLGQERAVPFAITSDATVCGSVVCLFDDPTSTFDGSCGFAN